MMISDQEVMTGIWYRYQRQVLMISEFDLMWSRYKQTVPVVDLCIILK